MKRLQALLMVVMLGISVAATSAGFDHQHRAWSQLLSDHVRWFRDGTASAVDYAGFRADAAKLDDYLAMLSGVSRDTFDAWGEDQQLAFLINAYNAFTVRLILNQEPGLESIRDIGGLFGSPWDQRFFSLLGRKRTLDEVEHEMIRPWFGDPRIHMAVNCASVGCPALARTAYTDDALDTQLDDAVTRFLSDSTRNRYKPVTRQFEVSPIFKWYGDDWNAKSGYPGGIRGFLLQHLALLAPGSPVNPEDARDADIEYLDYDWSLNSLENKTE